MLGIIGAMSEEVAGITKQMKEVTVTTVAGMEFCNGKIGDKEVVVVQSGIGKVNAAVCSQILADRFQVSAIINTGIAGSLEKNIDIGDIVISSDVVHHDVDAVGFGYAVGQIPRMAVLAFEADLKLVQLAKKCSQEANPDVRTHVGRVLSGDQFICDRAKKDWLVETFHGVCTEMEGAAIAQTAYLNGIPFLIMRAISDKADDSATVDYSEFEKKAIENSVRMLLKLAAAYQI